MKSLELRKLLIAPLGKMFLSQETSFQRSSLLDFDFIGPIRRKEVSCWPLYVHKGQGTSSLFGDGTSDLVRICGWQEVSQVRS